MTRERATLKWLLARYNGDRKKKKKKRKRDTENVDRTLRSHANSHSTGINFMTSLHSGSEQYRKIRSIATQGRPIGVPMSLVLLFHYTRIFCYEQKGIEKAARMPRY